MGIVSNVLYLNLESKTVYAQLFIGVYCTNVGDCIRIEKIDFHAKMKTIAFETRCSFRKIILKTVENDMNVIYLMGDYCMTNGFRKSSFAVFLTRLKIPIISCYKHNLLNSKIHLLQDKFICVDGKKIKLASTRSKLEKLSDDTKNFYKLLDSSATKSANFRYFSKL